MKNEKTLKKDHQNHQTKHYIKHRHYKDIPWKLHKIYKGTISEPYMPS